MRRWGRKSCALAFVFGLCIGSIVILMGGMLLLRATGLVNAVQVVGGNMEPTIQRGAILHYHYPLGQLNRGDIVVYRHSSVLFIMRIIALPAETVEIGDGHVFINGSELYEPYLKEATTYSVPKLQLGAGEYFVLGDHRGNSMDSHVTGPILQEDIVGVVFR